MFSYIGEYPPKPAEALVIMIAPNQTIRTIAVTVSRCAA
jgi:hypothetical protein